MDYYLGAVLLSVTIGVLMRTVRAVRRHNLAPISYEEIGEIEGGFLLFLRAFEEDDAVTSLPTSLFTLSVPPSRYEEDLARLLSRKCTLIAIGRPGEKLPPLGARRLYLTDGEWQARVASLMKEARGIILSPSLSEGTRWEIDEILRECHQTKTTFFLWLGDSREERIRRFYHSKLSQHLEKKHSILLGPYVPGARYCYFPDRSSLRSVLDPRELPLLRAFT